MKTKVSHLEFIPVFQTYKIDTVIAWHLEKDNLAQ